MKRNKAKTIKTNHLGGVQGDVPILAIPNLTPGGKPTKTRIVALGETTGHHHQIKGDVEVYEVERDLAGQLFKGWEVVVTEGKPATIEHNSNGEHATIEMTPGLWFIPAPGFQQVQYDGEQERRMLD